ncbi:MAG: hypothetical protein QOE99_973 [Actinomycetota bacterium]|jgi:hypothetical protein|nr:hypothetical protein [Actinomycetota bacterium]
MNPDRPTGATEDAGPATNVGDNFRTRTYDSRYTGEEVVQDFVYFWDS